MPVEPDDAALVRRSRAGDEQALNQLLARHQHRWYVLCRRLTDSEADALDATQEAMIAIVRGLERFDGRAAFTTWAYRVATNACLDQRRRARRRPSLAVDPQEGLDRLEADPGGADPGHDQQVADRLALEAGLAQLRPEFRVAVVLRDVSRARLRRDRGTCSTWRPGTVRSRIARGRRALADHLADHPEPTAGNPSATEDVERTTP